MRFEENAPLALDLPRSVMDATNIRPIDSEGDVMTENDSGRGSISWGWLVACATILYLTWIL